MDTIFLDTNCIRNQEANRFFGNVSDIQKASNIVDIAIPSIVIDEIIRQKRRFLKSQLDKIKNNYFSRVIGFDGIELKVCKDHIEHQIQSLFNDSQDEFTYKIVKLKHKGKLKQIKQLAIKNIAPFEANSDKGFKDTYIHLTISEFLKTADDDVFLLTSDSRLKESFKYKKVTVISNIQDYFKYRQEYFKEDYFLERLNEYFEREDLNAKNILSAELNEDDNWEIRVEVEGEEKVLDVDFYSKEIIDDN